VPVDLHTSSLVYPAGFLFVLALLAESVRGPRLGSLAGALVIEGFLVFLWACLLVHEFAHVLLARWCGIGTRRIVILPIGAAALMTKVMRDKREFWIALAGPVASLALAGLCWLGLQGLADAGRSVALALVRRLLAFGCTMNIVLALFNLLPCFPMDGGRMLRSLLALGLEFVFRIGEARAFVLATRIIVRLVNPLLVLGAIAFTIVQSHIWIHLLLFPIMLLAGEVEFRLLLRKSSIPPRRRFVCANGNASGSTFRPS